MCSGGHAEKGGVDGGTGFLGGSCGPCCADSVLPSWRVAIHPEDEPN